MDFGMTIPNSGPLARREPIMTIARQGEALGFNYMAMADHLVIPKSWNSRYPYSASGTIDAFDGGDCFDPLALATEKIQLLTGVPVFSPRPRPRPLPKSLR
jgi:alkanesulfonate monooxygenase SsuD/methylene tetrahydromethanopterin reductase-like flavin-dependent oxidoreductase (luciferase family)